MATPEETTALKHQESPRLTTQSERASPSNDNNVDFGSFAMYIAELQNITGVARSFNKAKNEHHTKTLDEANTPEDIDEQIAAFTDRLHQAYKNASKPLKHNDTFTLAGISTNSLKKEIGPEKSGTTREALQIRTH
ncbi:hypothetical protein TNCV_1498821 [Trichonephila clavipes]|nr:hypothetical protein TNCV_1498821 [Trichonephila clavipes]